MASKSGNSFSSTGLTIEEVEEFRTLSPQFLAAYKLGGDHNLIGVTRAVGGMALRRSAAGKAEAAQALRELESDLRAVLLDRGVTNV